MSKGPKALYTADHKDEIKLALTSRNRQIEKNYTTLYRTVCVIIVFNESCSYKLT